VKVSKVLRLILINHWQQPVFQPNRLVKVYLPFLHIVQFLPSMPDSRCEIVSVKELPVERAHQNLGGTDRHRIAHRQHQLYTRLHQAAPQAGLAGSNLLTRLAGIQNRNRYLVSNQQLRQLTGLNQVRLIILFILKGQESSISFILLEWCTTIAIFVQVTIRIMSLLKLIVGKHGSMHIEVHHMIVASTMPGRHLA
jgi:hypothetical protein